MKSELKRLALYFMHGGESAVFVDGQLWHWGFLEPNWPSILCREFDTHNTKDYWFALPDEVPNPERVLIESEMPISLFEEMP